MGFVRRDERLNSFYLDNQSLIHYEIRHVRKVHFFAVVLDRKWHLPDDRESMFHQVVREARLVCVLEQTDS